MVVLPGCKCLPCCRPFPDKVLVKLGNVVGSTVYRAFRQTTILSNLTQIDQTFTTLFKPLDMTGEYELIRTDSTDSNGASYRYEDAEKTLTCGVGPPQPTTAIFGLQLLAQGVVLKTKVLSGPNNVVSQADLESENWDSNCDFSGYTAFDIYDTQDLQNYPYCFSSTSSLNRFSQSCNSITGEISSQFETGLTSRLDWQLASPPPIPDLPWTLYTQLPYLLPVGITSFRFGLSLRRYWEELFGDFSTNLQFWSYDVIDLKFLYDSAADLQLPFS